jgi:hypothetical protein
MGRSRIYAALEKNPDLGHSTAVGNQFHKLIIEPLAAATGIIGPIVIVIDGLDALDSTDKGKLFTWYQTPKRNAHILNFQLSA